MSEDKTSFGRCLDRVASAEIALGRRSKRLGSIEAHGFDRFTPAMELGGSKGCCRRI
jgi:hypothetical protein